jgi:two-component SAPR family response regulator
MLVPDDTLRDVAVLVVEDDYFIATDIERSLEDAGARVIGPFSRTEQAHQALETSKVAMAVLDINIAGAMVFPLAQELRDAGIPFVFVTGYDARAIPADFAAVPRLVKPIEQRELLDLLGRALGGPARN